MKLELVYKTEKVFFNMFEKKYYSVKKGDLFKDMHTSIFKKDEYWWVFSDKYFDDCWISDYKKAKQVFDYLSNEQKEPEFYILESSE